VVLRDAEYVGARFAMSLSRNICAEERGADGLALEDVPLTQAGPL
jgi:hypothetical protein